MRRGNVAILFIVFSISVVVLAVLANKQGFFKLASKNVVQNSASVSTSPVPNISPKPSSKLNVDDLITYEVPKGWLKVGQNQDDGFGFETPNLTRTPAGGVDNGVSTVMLVSKSKDGTVGGDEMSGLVAPLSDKNKVEFVLDGRKTVSFHSDYEGYHNYHVVIFDTQKGVTVHLIFSTLNLDKEKQYFSDITQFLNSIKFRI